ncbi:45583_t:CDS:2 [Gigaspora margarita]|uniref:45583_t:CDS:1 n=1 Tax=Gigaspora margarita TaxID=4874 RepID=A0ABN7VKE7_GIGMA|nr:45583_t:CDS:2 [Gigaspora margarita]
MSTLSGKLARIVLPINHFGNHFNSQGRTIDTELATQNFRHASTMLCDIWCHDPIFGKYVNATYVDEATDPFINLEFLFDGFLPPVTKARDSHYINPIHLQYSDKFKIPDYDAHCPSISQTTYH